MLFPVKLLIAYLVFGVWGLNAYALEPAEGTDMEAQCRQEAESYGIPSEQLEEYIDGCMLANGGSLSTAPEQSAGIETQCRQEAKDYGVAPEQQTEYINGCILSLGGNLPSVSVDERNQEETVPVSTDGDSQELMQDSGEVQ